MRLARLLFLSCLAISQLPVAAAQTIDLVCEGDVREEILIIGKGYLTEPSLEKTTRNYHFLDGRLMKEERYPTERIVDTRLCEWNQGEVKCNRERTPECSGAFAEGAIPPELSFCRESVQINRYNGIILEIRSSFHSNFTNRGRAIIINTFKGRCEFAPKRRF